MIKDNERLLKSPGEKGKSLGSLPLYTFFRFFRPPVGRLPRPAPDQLSPRRANTNACSMGTKEQLIREVKKMEVQYIYDENGRNIGVIISPELWDKVKDKVEVKVKEEIFNPSQYRGIYKSLSINFEEEIRCLREEWTRNI